MAFYSDRLSVFHVQARDRAQRGPGLSQFGRALRELNIDLLCARSPEAKGRVERANGTLQDRLVKELRLRGLNDPVAATPFLPESIADYNRRFAKPPAVAYDAHRPLRPEDDLARIFTLQATRRISRQLTVLYKRDLYVLEDVVGARRLRGATALVSEAEDGSVTIRANDRVLAARRYPTAHARIAPGAVVASTSTSRASSNGSLPNSRSAIPAAWRTGTSVSAKRNVSAPALPRGSRRLHRGEADISTLERSGHLYIVLT